MHFVQQRKDMKEEMHRISITDKNAVIYSGTQMDIKNLNDNAKQTYLFCFLTYLASSFLRWK